MTAPKPSAKPMRKLGHLVCHSCKRSFPYSAIGDPELDMDFPLHRCGREIRPFDTWIRDDVPSTDGGAK